MDGDSGSEEQKALDAAIRGLELFKDERLGIEFSTEPDP